jgi:hypothetical protein
MVQAAQAALKSRVLTPEAGPRSIKEMGQVCCAPDRVTRRREPGWHSALGNGAEGTLLFLGSLAKTPCLQANTALVTGVVYGLGVEAVEDPLMKKVRFVSAGQGPGIGASRWG